MYLLIFSTISIIILIILLLSAYFKIKKSIDDKHKQKITSRCPDYWDIIREIYDDNGVVTGVECQNVHQLGKCGVNGNDKFVFEDSIYQNGENSDLERQNWVKDCGTPWT
jgi:hypothetical protein